MKTKIIAALLGFSLVSAPAFAWGDREQGILAGIASYWVYQKLNEPRVVVQRNENYTHPSYSRATPPPVASYSSTCRQVMTIEVDRYGNELRRPLTICE